MASKWAENPQFVPLKGAWVRESEMATFIALPFPRWLPSPRGTAQSKMATGSPARCHGGPLLPTNPRWPPKRSRAGNQPNMATSHTRWPPVVNRLMATANHPGPKTIWPPSLGTEPRWPPSVGAGCQAKMAAGEKLIWPPLVSLPSPIWPLMLPNRPGQYGRPTLPSQDGCRTPTGWASMAASHTSLRSSSPRWLPRSQAGVTTAGLQ